MSDNRLRLTAFTAFTALAPAAWGTTYLVTTELLPPDRPLVAATIRALPVGLLMVALGRQLPRGSWWWKAFTLGALNIGAFFALLFFAAYRLPGGVAATLGAVQPLLVAALAVPLLGQRLSGRTLLFGVAGVLGVGLLVLRGDAALDVPGIVAGVAATASMAAGVVLTKRWGRPVPLFAFTGWLLASGGLLLLPLALLVEGLPATVTGRNLVGFGYLAVITTGLGYAVWLRGIERLPATNVSFLGLMSPVVATVSGWVVLEQGLTGWQLVGMLLALGSLVLAQLPTRRPNASRLRSRAAAATSVATAATALGSPAAEHPAVRPAEPTPVTRPGPAARELPEAATAC